MRTQFAFERIIIEAGEIVGRELDGLRDRLALDPVQPCHSGGNLDLLAFGRNGELKECIEKLLPLLATAQVMPTRRRFVSQTEIRCFRSPGASAASWPPPASPLPYTIAATRHVVPFRVEAVPLFGDALAHTRAGGGVTGPARDCQNTPEPAGRVADSAC